MSMDVRMMMVMPSAGRFPYNRLFQTLATLHLPSRAPDDLFLDLLLVLLCQFLSQPFRSPDHLSLEKVRLLLLLRMSSACMFATVPFVHPFVEQSLHELLEPRAANCEMRTSFLQPLHALLHPAHAPYHSRPMLRSCSPVSLGRRVQSPNPSPLMLLHPVHFPRQPFILPVSPLLSPCQPPLLPFLLLFQSLLLPFLLLFQPLLLPCQMPFLP